MSSSEQTSDLDTALSKAQGVMKPAAFDRINPHFKSRYASLASIFEAIRKPFADNGLSVTQTTKSNGAGPVLITRLAHTTGQFIISEYQLPSGLNPQAMGSARTYARRQEISAVCGVVADEDDDANEATTAVKKYGNKPEEFVENVVQYDEHGQEIGNIPAGEHGLEKMSKAMARPEYANLLADIKNTKDLHSLQLWGSANANRVATLPDDWQVHLRDEFRSRQIDLGWKPKEMAS